MDSYVRIQCNLYLIMYVYSSLYYVLCRWKEQKSKKYTCTNEVNRISSKKEVCI
jgi:hypothetical protein